MISYIFLQSWRHRPRPRMCPASTKFCIIIKHINRPIGPNASSYYHQHPLRSSSIAICLCPSSLSHDSSNRDTNPKIKVNRSHRPHRISSSENMGINNQESKSDNKTRAHETMDLIKKLVEVVKEHESQSST